MCRSKSRDGASSAPTPSPVPIAPSTLAHDDLIYQQIAQLRADLDLSTTLLTRQTELIESLRTESAELRALLQSSSPSSRASVTTSSSRAAASSPPTSSAPASSSSSNGFQSKSSSLLEKQYSRTGSGAWILGDSSAVPDASSSSPPSTPAWARRSGASRLEQQASLAYSHDRRLMGGFDARFHSASSGATPKDYRVLPGRIILVRHALSMGNVDSHAYAHIPDNQISLTEEGRTQARDAGLQIYDELARHYGGDDFQVFFYTSPYKRSFETYSGMADAFLQASTEHAKEGGPHGRARLAGWQEEVQLREQDFGNFQDPEGKQREKTERLRFGRFFYRFPNGESGADVYDRITSFQNTMLRDINAGRFSSNTSIVLVTHGLALRVFLMSWFHWTVEQFLQVYNPDNASPVVLELEGSYGKSPPGWVHTKALYTISQDSRERLRGLTEEMCKYYGQSCQIDPQ